MNISRIPKRIFGRLSKVKNCTGAMTIITGASEDFYDSLRYNLLDSIMRYEPNANVIIWNLGLSNAQLVDYSYLRMICGGG